MSTSWWSILASVMILLVGFWSGGCRDDESDGDGDGDGDGDSDVDADADGDGNGDGDVDADADQDAEVDTERITCTEVVLCIDECVADDDCALDCAARVCGPAGQELAALLTCTANHCGAATCTDRQSSECQNCIVQHCPAQTVDCYAASCVPGERSCGEVSICLAGCGTDGDCEDECLASICPGGSDELENMTTCMGDSCTPQCDDLSSPPCGNCLSEHCGGPVNTCIYAPCY